MLFMQAKTFLKSINAYKSKQKAILNITLNKTDH